MTDPGIKIRGQLAAHTFLLETAFAMILALYEEGQRAAFEELAASILGELQKSPANPNAATPGAVAISDESERQLKVFLQRLSRRIDE
jgi:hypothetical protein